MAFFVLAICAQRLQEAGLLQKSFSLFHVIYYFKSQLQLFAFSVPDLKICCITILIFFNTSYVSPIHILGVLSLHIALLPYLLSENIILLTAIFLLLPDNLHCLLFNHLSACTLYFFSPLCRNCLGHCQLLALPPECLQIFAEKMSVTFFDITLLLLQCGNVVCNNCQKKRLLHPFKLLVGFSSAFLLLCVCMHSTYMKHHLTKRMSISLCNIHL